VSQYQKCKTNLDSTEARHSEWQRHQLGHMQVCTSLQTDNHASNPPLSFYRSDALPAAQPTASKHWRYNWLFRCTKIGKTKPDQLCGNYWMVCIKHGLNRPNKIQKAFCCDILTIYTDYAGEDVCDLASFRQYGYYSLVQKSSVFLWVWIWWSRCRSKMPFRFCWAGSSHVLRTPSSNFYRKNIKQTDGLVQINWPTSRWAP